MPSKALPDGWLDYRPHHMPIFHTNIIPFKTPLRDSVFDSRPSIVDRWAPRDVMAAIPNLGLIVDLSFAQNPRYPIAEFERNGINYVQLKCPGQQIPEPKVVSEFAGFVDRFNSSPRNRGRLIGVHCTHGVNRTGYVVCRYMIDYLNCEPQRALYEFGRARGHDVERENYREELLRSRHDGYLSPLDTVE